MRCLRTFISLAFAKVAAVLMAFSIVPAAIAIAIVGWVVGIVDVAEAIMFLLPQIGFFTPDAFMGLS